MKAKLKESLDRLMSIRVPRDKAVYLCIGLFLASITVASAISWAINSAMGVSL